MTSRLGGGVLFGCVLGCAVGCGGASATIGAESQKKVPSVWRGEVAPPVEVPVRRRDVVRPMPHDGELAVTSLSAHLHGTCALLSNGSVACWVEGMRASLDVAKNLLSGEAAVVPELVRGLPPVVEVARGAGHRCARTEAGQVWCWGENGRHQVGRRTVHRVDFQPLPIPGLSGVKRLAVGGELTCVGRGAGGPVLGRGRACRPFSQTWLHRQRDERAAPERARWGRRRGGVATAFSAMKLSGGRSRL